MAESFPATAPRPQDDALTIVAISLLAGMISDILHEGVGHAAVALLTVANSGVLSTVAWSSSVDSRLVAAGGTLVNLAAGVIFWIVLCFATRASVRWRLFFLLSFAFNLFGGTGYFFFSGISNFGDWAVVIAPMSPHWLWRILLTVVGLSAYFGTAIAVGSGLVRYVGVPRNDRARFRKFTFIPYFSGVLLLTLSGLLNPVGLQLVFLSALPASAGADSGLLWMRFYIPKNAVPERGSQPVERSYAWVGIAAILSLAFILVLGRGITLRR